MYVDKNLFENKLYNTILPFGIYCLSLYICGNGLVIYISIACINSAVKQKQKIEVNR